VCLCIKFSFSLNLADEEDFHSNLPNNCDKKVAVLLTNNLPLYRYIREHTLYFYVQFEVLLKSLFGRGFKIGLRGFLFFIF
jgi:hypothetical protein